VQSWDPFSDSFRIVERFGGRFREGWPEEAQSGDDADALLPRADLFEDAEGLSIEIELPGIGAQDVVVTVSADTIIVEAQRSFTRNGRSVVQLELPYGRLRRQFQLPVRALPARAMAEMKLGILRIFVPQAVQAGTETRKLVLNAEESVRSITVH
jgi:HSP20 family protein